MIVVRRVVKKEGLLHTTDVTVFDKETGKEIEGLTEINITLTPEGASLDLSIASPYFEIDNMEFTEEETTKEQDE